MLEIFTSLSVAFRSLGGLKLFGEKYLGKCSLYTGIAVMPRLCYPGFHFHDFNDLVQNKFRFIIHILSQHLLDQSHRRKPQMNVQDLLKVNNKDTRPKVIDVILVSLLLTLNTFHIMLYCF